jgi:predicted nucleotidyltransferase
MVREKMKTQQGRNSLTKILQEVFKKNEEVQFAYLYGSVAMRAQTLESDIDVAVYLKPMNINDFVRTEEKLTIALIMRLHNDRVDLRVLNALPFLMQYTVLRDGILIFRRNELERVDFETQVMIRFFDLKPYLDEYRRTLSSKIRGSL